MDRNKARELLIERRAALENVSRVAIEQVAMDEPQDEASGELAASDGHIADVATDTLEREVGLSVRETAEEGIREVEAALQRLEDGTYGVCPVCETPIDPARLEARPEAEFCVDHQPTSAA